MTRHTPEQIIPKLRQAEADLAQGLSIAPRQRRLHLAVGPRARRGVDLRPGGDPGAGAPAGPVLEGAAGPAARAPDGHRAPPAARGGAG